MTKEWQEATNKRAREMNLNPITGLFYFYTPSVLFGMANADGLRFTGISSEGYKGTGFVTESK